MPGEGPIPIIGYHRGVGLHDQQGPERLAIVRAEIDRVIELSDLRELVAWAEDAGHAPESRLLAGAKALATISEFSSARQKRPHGITAEYVEAVVAGLGSTGWRSRNCYGTLVDEGRGAVERETPLIG